MAIELENINAVVNDIADKNRLREGDRLQLQRTLQAAYQQNRITPDDLRSSLGDYLRAPSAQDGDNQ